MTSFECESSFNCTLTLPNGNKIARDCFESQPRDTRKLFCDCPTTFGYTGDSCSNPSAQTYILFGIYCTLIITSLYAVSLSVKLTIDYINLKQEGASPSKLLAALIFLSTVSVLFEIARGTAGMITLLDISLSTVSTAYVADEQVTYSTTLLGIYSFIFKSISLYLAFILMLFMMLYCLTIVQSVASILSKDKIENIKTLKMKAIIVTASFSAILIAGVLLYRPLIVNGSGIVLSVLLCLMSNSARAWFISTFSSLRCRIEAKIMTHIVTNFSTRYILATIFALATFATFAIVQSISADVNSGSVDYSSDIAELTYIVKNLVIIYTLTFVKKVFNNLKYNLHAGASRSYRQLSSSRNNSSI